MGISLGNASGRSPSGLPPTMSNWGGWSGNGNAPDMGARSAPLPGTQPQNPLAQNPWRTGWPGQPQMHPMMTQGQQMQNPMAQLLMGGGNGGY